MPTIIKENYLKALFFLNDEGGGVNVTELSKRLGVSKPTANGMVRRLEEQNWVIYNKYKPIKLTEKGRKAAALVVRKHRLTELFLHKVMGFGWEEVHEIAEEMEHIHSEKLFTRMDEMLDHPDIDPHGSPIPDKDGNLPELPSTPLTEVQEGQTVRLVSLANSSTSLLEYLNKMDIAIGTIITLKKRESFDGSCLIKMDKKPSYSISRKVAESLLVASL